MPAKKAVLGRGLNALLATQDADEAIRGDNHEEPGRSRVSPFDDRIRLVGRIAEIDIDLIRPNPYQPRRDFDEQALDELAASISQLGIIQPVTVRSVENGRYEIISGERRLRASRKAGLKFVPAFVREADTEEMLEMALVENVQREELNPIEVAFGYQRLMDECGLTQDRVALKVGKNRATVANTLRLLKLPPRIQASVRDGNITAGHARALISVENEQVQLALLKNIEDDGISVREVEERVRRLQAEPAKPVPAGNEPVNGVPAIPIVSERDLLQLRSFCDRLRSRFSTQVHIKHRAGSGGKIEIAYYSDDDLERLLELLLSEE